MSFDFFKSGVSAPICLTWELTYACNLACTHCLSSSGKRRPDELTLEEIRGLVDLSMDIYDRPEFVHELMRVCTDWIKGFYRRLGETGIHSISMNETWTGVGVAREHFVEFMKPYEAECVAAAHDAGLQVIADEVAEQLATYSGLLTLSADATLSAAGRATIANGAVTVRYA